jgi:RNA-binding protein Musashi
MKTEEPVQPEVKAEKQSEQVVQSNNDDEHMHNGEEEEDDDEIDFNLGNGNSYQAHEEHDGSTIGIKEDG